jgi:hypothetical protein
MKRAWMFGAAAAILLSFGCESQKPEFVEDFSGIDQKSDKFSKAMKLLGSLDYGQTATADYRNPPKYRAYKFGGQKGDQVTVDVSSQDGDSIAWVVDNNFKVIKRNDDYQGSLDSHIEVTLPGNTNPDIITYYIVFTEFWGDNAHFKVSLQGTQQCVERVFCIQGSHFDSTKCQCVPDAQFCGGIAGIRCPAGQNCVDDPTDSCDPAHGGADCGGICVPANDPCSAVRCTSGTQCTNCFDGPRCLASGEFCAL